MAKRTKSAGPKKRPRVLAKGRKEAEGVQAKVQTFVENMPFDGSKGAGLDPAKLQALMSSGPETSKKVLQGSGPETSKK